MNIQVLPDPEALARAAAAEFVRYAAAAVRDRGVFHVALSGGRTPRRMHELLADESGPFRARVQWERARFFWGDERHVPPDDPESNYRMALETLLSRVPVPESNVHRIHGEDPDAAAAAAAYEQELRGCFGLGPAGCPRLDLVFLGMGPEGHTASLFPGSPAIRERERLVAAPWVEKLHTYRVTMTPPVFNRAAAVVFLVEGPEKAGTLKAVLEGPRLPDTYPAQIIEPAGGTLLWLADREAAALLNNRGE